MTLILNQLIQAKASFAPRRVILKRFLLSFVTTIMFSSFLWGNSSEASVAFDKSHLLRDDLTLSKHLSTSDLLAQNIPDPNKLIKEAQREAAEAAKRKKEAENRKKQKEQREAAEREESDCSAKSSCSSAKSS